MIHIVTSHRADDGWIQRQLKYFKRFIHEPYRLYVTLPTTTVPSELTDAGHCVITVDKDTKLPARLKHMLQRVNAVASPDDLLIFIACDALPIGDIIPYIRGVLSTRKLMAIQRRENAAEMHPQLAFCATTVGTWNKLGCTWEPYNSFSALHDDYRPVIGGYIEYKLKQEGINWYPMHRSNTRNIHPVLFGIYDGMIYYHGSGASPICTEFDKLLYLRSPRLYAQVDMKVHRHWRQYIPELIAMVVDTNAILSSITARWIDNDEQWYDALLGRRNLLIPQQIPRVCSHFHRHFKVVYTNRADIILAAVECLQCYARGPVGRYGMDAEAKFRSARDARTLIMPGYADWVHRLKYMGKADEESR